MTKEEIEAAREHLESIIGLALVSTYATEADGDEAQAYLDALCAAARQPESLVGRRVRHKRSNGRACVVGITYKLEFDRDSFSSSYDRDDFDLLEDGNASQD